MSTYKIADGFNVALGSMTDINPQPRSDGIRIGRRVYTASGLVVDEALYIELMYDVLTVAVYQNLLSQFGLSAAKYNNVTVYVPDDTYTFVRMNGTIIRPQPGSDVRRNIFLRDVMFLVRNLEPAS